LVLGASGAQAAPQRPNILWLSAEDISPHLGCYGDPHAQTPHLDQLATESVRYTHAFTTAGVCAPCRSGIITGMYQTTLGTHHMRSLVQLPKQVRPFPAYLREAGYYTANNSKEDYQFVTPEGVWDDSSTHAHWRDAAPGQPFFAVFNFMGCHESGITGDAKYREVTGGLTLEERQDAAQLTTLPPYYADTPTIREDWKRNYELITAMDAWAGNLIAQLQADGLYENTIIMFWSDHGVGLPRAKRWLYDSGTHIPLIVRIPEKFRAQGQGTPGSVQDELVSSIDLGPTVLRLAGVEVPDHCQGRPFLGNDLDEPRKYVFGARDRMDERYDIIRLVRDQRFLYLRNYEPWKPYYQYMNTAEQAATMSQLRSLHEAGQLPDAAERYFAASKPAEELYDTHLDPHQLHNLAGDPQCDEVLRRMRQAQAAWATQTKDLGLVPEPILCAREATLGDRYAVLRQPEGDALAQRLVRAAALASEPAADVEQLLAALADPDAAVRYWGAVGLANPPHADQPQVQPALEQALSDPSVAVQVAAANALCQRGAAERALPLLVQVLQEGQQWERLQAALVLDEIDEQALPVVEAMRAALVPRSELEQKGKYTVRVLNRALNELEGTTRQVR
jgi:uncharacterized sulfatase